MHLYLGLDSDLAGMLWFRQASQRERRALLSRDISMTNTRNKANVRAPLASFGAVFRQLLHSLEEQGMS